MASRPRTNPIRVLCVDDEVHVLAIVTDTLRERDYHVETAVDGAHALEKIATAARPYDLIIADARMPNLDGWRFIMQARANGYDGKVIIFSAWLDEDERRRYRGLNIDVMIDKPPKSGELLAAVERIVPKTG